MQDLKAVAEFKLAGELEDLYREWFQKKFSQQPFIDQEGDKLAFSWLASKIPQNQARAAIEAYFYLTDKYVVEKMFPPKLIKTNINPILALVKKRGIEGTQRMTERVLHIRTLLNCDFCANSFYWIGEPKVLSSFEDRECEECKKIKKEGAAKRRQFFSTRRPLEHEEPQKEKTNLQKVLDSNAKYLETADSVRAGQDAAFMSNEPFMTGRQFEKTLKT